MNSEIMVLHEMSKLFSDPENWTHDAYARDASGDSADIFSYGGNKNAPVQWCIVGGIKESADRIGADRGDTERILTQAARTLGYNPSESLEGLNDNYGYRSVMDIIDKAIEICRESKGEDN